MSLKIRKIVGALPATLDPDTVYLHRVGSIYHQYVTNNAGIPFEVGQLGVHEWSQRATIFQNNQWSRWSLNRGQGNVNMTNTSGNGATPDVEFRQVGPILRPGQILKDFEFAGTVNSSDVANIEWQLYHQFGPYTPFGSWNSAAVTQRNLLSSGTLATGGANSHFRSPLDEIDYEVVNQGFLLFFVRTNSVITADRFFRYSAKSNFLHQGSIVL